MVVENVKLRKSTTVDKAMLGLAGSRDLKSQLIAGAQKARFCDNRFNSDTKYTMTSFTLDSFPELFGEGKPFQDGYRTPSKASEAPVESKDASLFGDTGAPAAVPVVTPTKLAQ